MKALVIQLGCVPSLLKGRVNAASYEPTTPGQAFIVISPQALNLTERRIQSLIAEKMASLGFVSVNDPYTADLAVVYSYSTGQGRAIVSSSPDLVYGGHSVRSNTLYPRYFQISLVDLQASRERNNIVIAWQGEIYSEGSSQDISLLAEHFIEQIFKRFGKSTTNEPVLVGITRSIF